MTGRLEAGPGGVPSGGPSGSRSPQGGVRQGQRVAAIGVSRGVWPRLGPTGTPIASPKGGSVPHSVPPADPSAVHRPCDGRPPRPSLGHLATVPGILLGAGQGAHRPGLIGAGGPLGSHSRGSEPAFRGARILWGAGVDR